MRLYPRLPLAHASALASSFDGVSAEDLRRRHVPHLEGQRFAPTGGGRVTEPEMLALRRELDRIADAAGFPVDSVTARQEFDRRAAAFLGAAGLPSGEMLRAETWAWVTVCLVPHLVQWRFGGSSAGATLERFAGSLQRNTIGRLWFRAWVFDGGDASAERWALVNSLPEDATVAILERTRIASDHRLARELALRWVARRGDRSVKSEDVLREAAKRIRVLALVRELGALDERELGDSVEVILEATVGSLRANAAI
jgi:hypothetical protein